MSNVLPDPKAPKESTDYIYGKRMDAYEDRMNFFLNEKVDVKKDDVEDKDKETVDGLEALVNRFTSYATVKIPQLPAEYDGNEAVGKKALDFIVQLAKDLVDFILNLVNNRISRLERRTNKTSMARKNDGIINKPVKYPLTVRRLLTPLNASTDPNWVGGAVVELLDWYKAVMKAHVFINNYVEGDLKVLSGHVGIVTDAVRDILGMKDDSGTLQSAVLPSNRRFSLDINTDNPRDFKMFFANNNAIAKLRADEWAPSSFVMDNTLNKISSLIKEIKSNQSTVSQLYRKFEKKVKKIEGETQGMTQEERNFYSWIIGFDRRLLSTNLQYVMGGLDAALDFVNSGVKP